MPAWYDARSLGAVRTYMRTKIDSNQNSVTFTRASREIRAHIIGLILPTGRQFSLLMTRQYRTAVKTH